jgi:hypothetical protein
MRTRTLFSAAVALLAAGSLAAQQTPDLAPYLMADRAAEVSLARSAAPKNVSDSATVLVLTRSGFVEAAHGTNGFTCLVFRSFLGSLEDPTFWSPKVRGPSCFNPPAVKTVVLEIQKRAEWIMAGVNRTEIVARTKQAYATHEFPMPAPGAMTYMLSHEQYLADVNPHWMPHLMFYYDKTLPPAAYGAGGMTAPIIDGSVGDPIFPVLTLLIPVRQWSDGSPALPGAGR